MVLGERWLVVLGEVVGFGKGEEVWFGGRVWEVCVGRKQGVGEVVLGVGGGLVCGRGFGWLERGWEGEEEVAGGGRGGGVGREEVCVWEGGREGRTGEWEGGYFFWWEREDGEEEKRRGRERGVLGWRRVVFWKEERVGEGFLG